MKKLVLAVVLLSIILSGYQITNFLAGQAVRPSLPAASSKSKSSLYPSALKKIREVDPGDQRAASQIDQVVTKVLDQIEADLESGDSTEALDALKKLRQLVPENKAVDKAVKKHIKRNAKRTKPGFSLPKDLSPLAFLPVSALGYKVKNEWLIEPTMAGATYVPLEPGLQEQVERIFVTVEKFSSGSRAKKKLDQERKNSSATRIEPRFKQIGAYAGQSAGIASLAWVHENWFFFIQVAPNSASPPQQADIALAIFKLLVNQKFN